METPDAGRSQTTECAEEHELRNVLKMLMNRVASLHCSFCRPAGMGLHDRRNGEHLFQGWCETVGSRRRAHHGMLQQPR